MRKAYFPERKDSQEKEGSNGKTQSNGYFRRIIFVDGDD